jgi:hypothetical protein
MRYLKRQTLNRRIANDPQFYVDPNNASITLPFTSNANIVMGVNSNVLLPRGTVSQRTGTSTPVTGMMRFNNDPYNASTNPNGGQVEVYQGSAWRALRYKESAPIIQQNLGAGDGQNTYFGPLNSYYYNPSNVSSEVPGSGGVSSGQFLGQNVLVVVENVLQLQGINYTISSTTTPTIPAETYTGILSQNQANGSTLYFNTSLTATGASSSGSVTVTGLISSYTLSVTSGTGIAVGMTLTGTGVTAGTTVTAQNNATFVGYISGTTLTVTSTSFGAVAAGLVLTGGSTSAGTYIVSGSGSTWTVNNSQTVGSSGSPITFTGTSWAVSAVNSVSPGTSITGSGTLATLNFAAVSGNPIPFATGSTITVTGMIPVGYNGTYTVSSSTSTSVSYASTAIGSMTFAGVITSANAVYPSVNLTGATVTGTNIFSPTTVLSYTIDSVTDALTSISLSHAITGSVSANASIAIAAASQSGSGGYYINFTSPVPVGKTVTALLGFDQ